VIEEAKLLNTYPGVGWDHFCWDTTLYYHNRAHNKRRLNLYFTRQRKNRSEPYVPFAHPFADFFKAIIRTRASLRGIGYSFQTQMITAQRFLYEATIQHSTSDPTMLTRGHFQQAAMSAYQTHFHNCAYAVGALLEEVSNFVDDHRLTNTRINFRNPIKYPPSGDGLDQESQAKGLEKMPSSRALEALALASSKPLNENEQILLRVIDLFVVGGFRAGEGLTIPLDCWVEELALGEGGRSILDSTNKEPIKRCGLRYSPEKGGEPIVKWLPDHAVPLAKRAVDDLGRLCGEARKQAGKLEKTPNRVPLPGFHNPNDLLDRKQIAEITGLVYPGAVGAFVRNSLRLKPADKRCTRTNGRRANLYRVGDIESALLTMRGQLEVVRATSGRVQMLSESLCVMFCNQFRSKESSLRLLPELIGYKQLTVALGNDDAVLSIFSRRGLVEADNSPIRIRSHAFRHWLNTLADRGGLSDLELALWMGRRDPRQNAAYKHGTVAQRVEWAREAIKDGRLYGDIADIYNGMNDPVEKEEFLETFVSVAHFTPYGVCLHDFALEPCRYHLNCLSGCGEYARTNGDKEERSNLRQLRVFTERQLKMAEQAMTNAEYGASNWVDHNRRILTNTEAALAVDDDAETVEIGKTIRVFPGARTIGQPIS